MSGATRVLLVDDHSFFRSGLREILGEFDEIEVVGDAASGEAALALIERRKPDVVVMDLHMPGISGAEATRSVRERSPRTEVVMLTVSAAEDDVVEALEAGAAGYLLKDSQGEEILRAIRAAAQGGSVLSPSIARAVVDRARRMHPGGSTTKALADLSDRERQVLRLLADGKDNAEIAAELFVSVATVKHTVSALLRKLEATNRLQAAIKGVRSGLL
jgi:DNA-binding NarL/FixJ family response regulator